MADELDITDLTAREYLVLERGWLRLYLGEITARRHPIRRLCAKHILSRLPEAEHGHLFCERQPAGEHVALAAADVQFLR